MPDLERDDKVNLRLQIIIGIIIFLLLLFIINMVRNKKVDLRYALSWMFLAVILLLLDVFPQIVYIIAELVGIETPSNMVFFFGFLFVVILVYSLTVSVSRLSIKTKRLTQEIALLRKELERKNEKE